MKITGHFAVFVAFLFLGTFGLSAQDTNNTLNVVILGDSITWLGGDDCSAPKGWTKWFKEKFDPASCRSYARSGATWTNTPSTRFNVTENTGTLSNDNVIFNQINRLMQAFDSGRQAKPDIILIAAGTNDAWFEKHRPNAFSQNADQAFSDLSGFITDRQVSDVVTLASSVRYGCEMLMEKFPDAQIILLTPLQSTSVLSEKIRLAGDIIEDCAHYLCVGCIRQDFEGCVYQAREAVSKRFTYDGAHTSEDGARRNGRFIANKVNSILQY